MKIFNSIEEFCTKGGTTKTIITQGTFDGVHLGHQRILGRMSELADKNNAQSVLLTFEPHPRFVIYGKTDDLHLLSTPEEKIGLLEKSGVQNLIIHPFTKELANLSAAGYVNNILVEKLHAHTIITGHDHRFGKNREGNIDDLKYWGGLLGFAVEEVAPLQINGLTISSTKIRQAISAGNMSLANALLGYNYGLTAMVVHGKRLGASLGYPTANLETTGTESKENPSGYKKLIPPDGIYAVLVWYQDAMYKGMMSIGMNPTIKDKGRSMEVNIFDFNLDIYNKALAVEFVHRIRNEEKFNNLEELKSQLSEDKKMVLELLK